MYFVLYSPRAEELNVVTNVSCASYLSSQGQEVAVELHVGHDFCQVLVVLYILI